MKEASDFQDVPLEHYKRENSTMANLVRFIASVIETLQNSEACTIEEGFPKLVLPSSRR